MLRTYPGFTRIGFSTGLAYAPGCYAPTKELISLAKIAKQYNGIYVTHMRSEMGNNILPAIQEVITIAKAADIPVHISHLKHIRPYQDVQIEQILELIETARKQGIDITADQYPYTAGSSHLSFLLPLEFQTAFGVKPEYHPRNKKILAAIENLFLDIPPEDIFICEAKEFSGKTIAEIAKLQNKDPIETFAELAAVTNAPEATFILTSEANIKAIMPNEHVFTGTDAAAVPENQHYHPRFYGTFPRKIKKYALDEKTIDLQFAIRSMTSLPAKKFSIKQRGEIRTNFYADIAIFDLKTITDRANYSQPSLYSEGIKYLLINGRLIDVVE